MGPVAIEASVIGNRRMDISEDLVSDVEGHIIVTLITEVRHLVQQQITLTGMR